MMLHMSLEEAILIYELLEKEIKGNVYNNPVTGKRVLYIRATGILADGVQHYKPMRFNLIQILRHRASNMPGHTRIWYYDNEVTQTYTIDMDYDRFIRSLKPASGPTTGEVRE
jgi:hypothetical protein